jgi:hypothetical protein
MTAVTTSQAATWSYRLTALQIEAALSGAYRMGRTALPYWAGGTRAGTWFFTGGKDCK